MKLFAQDCPALKTLAESPCQWRTRRLDKPLPVSQTVQSQPLGDFSRYHRVGQVLLVGESEHHSMAHVALIQHPVSCLYHSVDLTIRTLVKVPPTSHTVKLQCLYSTVYTLKHIVGMLVTTSLSFNLWRLAVFPAASHPNHQDSHLANESLPHLGENPKPTATK